MKRIIAGPNAVTETLRATPGAIEAICVAESMRPSSVLRIEELATRARVAIEFLPKLALDEMAGDLIHQGVVAITGAYPYLDLDGLIGFAAKTPSPLLVALDQVQDPRNLGAVMRSAYAFGASGVILTKDRSAQVTAAAVRTSAGASELLKVARVTNLVRSLDQLKDSGYQVFGAAMGGDARLFDMPLGDQCVIVLGNEGKGIRRLTAEHCDRLYSIPMQREFDSLNVSAAAAISLYEAARQRSGR